MGTFTGQIHKYVNVEEDKAAILGAIWIHLER